MNGARLFPVTRDDAEALCHAYRSARSRILSIANPLEQELGLASLRLRAAHFLKEAVTTATNVEPNAWAPLRDYVANLAGGEAAEAGVDAFDAAALQAAQATLAAMLAGLTGAAMGAGLAFVLAVGLLFVDFGGWLAQNGMKLVLATHVPVALLALWTVRAMTMLDEAFRGQAASLGRGGEQAMVEAARLEAALWHRATGLDWAYRSFTERARDRAELLVWLTYTLLGISALLIGYGFLSGLGLAGPSPPRPAPLGSAFP